MTCYLCGCDEAFVRQKGVRDNPDIDVLQCTDCGLVYLSSFDSEPALHRSERDVEAWAKATLGDDSRRAKDFSAQIKGKRLLDFGCGNGNFLKLAKARLAFGIEMEDEAREFCRRRGLKVLADISGSPYPYDVITMFHVIEHIPGPIALLRELGTLLADNGKIIIETPNADDALLTQYDCKAFGRFTYWSKHPFLYNEDTLIEVARRAGLKATVEQYQRYPLSNHLYWLSRGKPNGHNEWPLIQDAGYSDCLAKLRQCDTIIATLEKE
jgi:SAM-dependent methyltransferase